MCQLPTIEEKGDDDQLSKQGTTESETKASDVAEDFVPELNSRQAVNGHGEVRVSEEDQVNKVKDEEVEEIEKDAADGFLEEAENEEQGVPELSEDIKQVPV